MEDKEQVISEFNEMGFQISRLHNDWLICKTLREQGKFPQLRWKLDSIELELIYDAEKIDNDKDTDYIKQLETVNGNIEKAKDLLNIEQFYIKLKEKERILRKVQQECGKGARYKSLDDDEMD